MELIQSPLLIVDDTRFSRALLKNTLEGAGYADIRVATTAKEAVHMLDKRRANVVLADWNMPEMNGLQLAQHIRKQDEDSNHYTAIILFTGNESTDLLIQAFEKGVDDYLTKSPDKREMIARVYSASRISELQNTLLETMSELMETNTRLMEIVTIDPLTGLSNRRCISKQLENILKEAKSRGGMVTLGILTIDKYKQLLKDHKDCSDEILIELASRLRRSIRPTDIIARYGISDFAIILFQRDAVTKTNAFKRIQTSISRRKIKLTSGDLKFTVSIGVANHIGDDETITQKILISAAEKKLKAAKRIGNRVSE